MKGSPTLYFAADCHLYINGTQHLAKYGFRVEEPDPYVSYKAIVTAYGTVSKVRLGDYLRKFAALQLSQYETPRLFIRAFSDISNILDGTQYEYRDESKSHFLLNHLMHLNPAFLSPLELQVEEGTIAYSEVLRLVSERFVDNAPDEGLLMASILASRMTKLTSATPAE